MATSTDVPIYTNTLASAASSVVIDVSGYQQYTNLKIVMSPVASSGSTTYVAMQFNSDTATNYSETYMTGNGSSATSARDPNVNATYLYNTGAPTTAGNLIVTTYLMNYASSSMNKTLLTRSNNASAYTNAYAGLWRSNSAITSITISPVGGSGTYAAGSTFSVYGIGTASPAKATGGAIYSDDLYWYHAFTNTGTFTPSQALTCDYLVVAGGGGGGSYSAGGGGGAGGLRSTVSATGGGGTLESAITMNSGTAYTITVGAGGSGAVNTSKGTNGGASSIAGTGLTTISAAGGGYGGGYNGGHFAAASGGSGGGANYSTYTTGGSGTANQGYAGGNGIGGTKSSGGGGGGAGSVGASGTSTGGGNGGNGVSIPVFSTVTGTGVNGYYAGGGGGATYDGTTAGIGGLGGGGNANGPASVVNPGNGFSGIISSGGGGGAAETTTAPPSNASGGNGGSGVVIVRYLK